MLQRLKNRTHGDEGFTLVELLVVILIIGILAAIALPTFLGQSAKAQDASAKSNARNAYSIIDSCGADKNGNYTGCSLSNSGLERTTVTITGGGATYNVVGTSASNNTFTITKASDGTAGRTCTVPSGGKEGAGCATSGGSW